MEDKLVSYIKHAAADVRSIHAHSLKLGFLCSTFLCNHLLNAYSARSMLADAHHLFDETPHPNVVTWSAIISSYSQSGNLTDAMVLFRRMQHHHRPRPSKFTFGGILTGCARTQDSITGAQVHCSAIKFGVESDTFLSDTLIHMYSKCGRVEESWRVFDQTPEKDTVSWTAIIACLANSGQECHRDAAFGTFKDMVRGGTWPVVMTFASLVKIFDEPSKINQGRQAHGCMLKLGIEGDDLLDSALIAMYGRCGGVEEAVRISVRMNMDVVSWTSLLVAYMENGYNWEAIHVFCRMIRESVAIDRFVIATVIGACATLKELRMGKEIHAHAVRHSFMPNLSVGNALITFYGRCGEPKMAESVFNEMKDRDIISWTAMLTCYGQNEYGEKALDLFHDMLREGLSPPIFVMSGAIKACSIVGSLSMGTQIHCRAVKMGTDNHLSVENSLITMYSKCGSIGIALTVFISMAERDVVSWNALIAGFSQHGFKKEAVELFNQMQKEGIRPDDYTFTAILVSCSRAGLVAEGCGYFRLMSVTYGLVPKMEHYACMVDLFSRAGKLRDAIDFIDAMPFNPDFLIWEALLAACKVHGNVELAESIAKNIQQMSPGDPSPYISLANMHASAGRWDMKECLREIIEKQCMKKEPGRSWVETQP